MRHNSTNLVPKRGYILAFTLFVFFFTQLNSFDHILDHKNSIDESTCLVCINTSDFIDMVAVDLNIQQPLPQSDFRLNLTDSVNCPAPQYYCSRAPPVFI